jgi:hypothetical protein
MLAWIGLIFLNPNDSAVGAQAALPNDGTPGYTGTATTVLKVNPDNTSEEAYTIRVRITTESALKQVGKQMFAFNELLDTLQIAEAFTEKADGRKVAVEAAAIFTQDQELPGNAADFVDSHDRRETGVVFGDLEVGDTIFATTRKISKANYGMQFSRSYSTLRGYDQSFTIISPKERPLSVMVTGEGFLHKTITDEATETHVITRSAKASPWSSPEEEPRYVETAEHMGPAILVASKSFPGGFGASYWAAAWAPNVEVTPPIKNMADEITRGISDRRLQAEAIDRWVKKNIRYVALVRGTAEVVPNSAATVLQYRYGDCKNRSALMIALLAAKDISSELAFIVAGRNAYSPPISWNFDHVFLYLPEFDAYTDSQLPLPFGVLKDIQYNKPVVRLSAAGVFLARIPPMKTDEHTITIRNEMQVDRDGKITGTTIETTTGSFSFKARKFVADLLSEGPQRSAALQLQKAETPGKGRFETSLPENFPGAFVLRGQFTLDEPIKSGASETWAPPIGLSIHQAPYEYFFGSRHPKRRFAFACYAGKVTEEIDVTFAERRGLPKPAKARTLRTPLFSYTSTYKLENRTLKIRRQFLSHVSSQVCGPEIEAVIAEPIKAVKEDWEIELSFSAPKPGRVPQAQRKSKLPATARSQSLSAGRG